MCNVVVVVSTVREDGRDGKQQQRLQPEHVVLVRGDHCQHRSLYGVRRVQLAAEEKLLGPGVVVVVAGAE